MDTPLAFWVDDSVFNQTQIVVLLNKDCKARSKFFKAVDEVKKPEKTVRDVCDGEQIYMESLE